jgi:ATPase subunit of ABC transporter with duplicated ATPase domains
VCTDIIHYASRQLRRYKGNLSEFVKAVPAAQSYYELEAATLKFRCAVFCSWGLHVAAGAVCCIAQDCVARPAQTASCSWFATNHTPNQHQPPNRPPDRFPTPGLLDGINSKEKPIAKLTGVNFAYPGATTPQLTDVNVAARLSSRVAVIGVNGAGKSVRWLWLDSCCSGGSVVALLFPCPRAFFSARRHDAPLAAPSVPS